MRKDEPYAKQVLYRPPTRPLPVVPDEAPWQAASESVTADYRRQKLGEVLGFLWRDKWLVLLLFGLVVGSVTAFIVTAPAEYEAESVLLIEVNQSPQRFSVDGLVSPQGRSLSNEVSILRQSYPIAERVAQRLFETKSVPETGEPLTILYNEEGQLLSLGQVVFRLQRKYVRIEPVQMDVDMIRIVATSTVPGEAALIANVYSEEYIGRAQEVSRSEITATRAFLEEQEDKLESELGVVENQLKTYMSAHEAVALDAEADQVVTQIAQLEALRDEVGIELEMRRASQRSLEEKLSEIEPNLVRRMASGVEAELEQLQALLVEEEMRREQIVQRNPEEEVRPSEEMRAINARIARNRERVMSLSEQYVEEVMAVGGTDPKTGGADLSYVSRMRQQLAETHIGISGLTAQLAAVRQRLREYEAKIREIPKKSIELAQLERTRQAKSALYISLVQALQEARVNEESELGYAEIIHPAFVPLEPVRPQVPRSLFLAVVFGLGLGLGVSLLRKLFDTRLYRPEDLQERGHQVIGVIPDMEPFIKRAYGGKKETTLEGRTVSTGLSMLLDPGAPLSEAWRQLRTTVRFGRPDHRTVQSLLITSAQVDEGKSTVAVNLGVAMAHAGLRTVIVDADLRRPHIHRMLGMARGPGLSQVLYEPDYFGLDFFATDVDNLYLIPAGSTVPNPSELLGSKAMSRLLARFRREFDMVILDAPPALPFTDALLLSTQCDGTIVIARAGQTDVRAFENTVKLLKGVGAVILGGVLNRLDERDADYQYAGWYSLSAQLVQPAPKAGDETVAEARAWRRRDADGAPRLLNPSHSGNGWPSAGDTP